MNNEQTEIVVTEKELLINMLLAAWEVQQNRFNALLDKLSDEDLAKETAPGRNTGVYLLGHLAAVNDSMITLLGLGDKMYPHLESTFITTPDKSGQQMPPIHELKEHWHTTCKALHEHFKKMTSDEWFGRHMSVSAEDFEKEPHRNKLNILISRTGHLAYHMGQMTYLTKK